MATNRDSRGGLVFKDSKIELTLNAGDVCEGYFEVETDTDVPMEGYVYSSSLRMRLKNDRVSGNNVTITYEYDSSGMQQGDVQKGSIMFVTNLGEYVISFAVTVRRSTIESSMGSIRNLFHFTNLAKSNWDEAAELFIAPGFIDIMSGSDARFRNLYLGLSGGGNRNHNLEEFLIGINKKKQIEYTVAEEDVKFAYTAADDGHTIELRRNGWGYTLLAAKAEGEFIELPENRISEQNFENNVCYFKYRIREDKLHAGRNVGRITFRHLYGSISVDIRVTYGERSRKSGMIHRAKVAKYSLARFYIDYCTGVIGRSKWIQQTEDIISHRVSIDSDDMENLLYQAYLLIIQERYNEAKWLLDRKITDVIEDESNAAYCFYLYLTALYDGDEYYGIEIYNKIKSIYAKDKDNWHIAWVMMHVGTELTRNAQRRYEFAVRQIELGCNSPIMYAEIVDMLNSEPALLMHFSYEEVRALRFGARAGMIGDELKGQIAYKALGLKNYDKRILDILLGLYDGNRDKDVLEAVCTQLIRGGLTGEQYLEWYLAGVNAGLNITRLYENYIMSLPEGYEGDIPKEVLMYFSYGREPEYEQAAGLYAYVLRNKDRYNDVYMAYGGIIERFISGQLKLGRINRDLAYLYGEFITTGMASQDDIRRLSELLLVHMIGVDDPVIASVIVRDERLKDELTYEVNDRKAYVTLPSSEYTILLEDTLGNRYYSTKEYSTERFFLPRKLMPVLEPYTGDSLLFDLYVCEGNKDYIVVGDRNVLRYAYLEQCEDVTDEFRAAIRLPLIRYYQDNENSLLLDEMLYKIDAEDVPCRDREELLRLLIARNQTDKAFEYSVYYGPENIDAQILTREATLLIDRDGYIEDERLTALIMSAFERGRYNDTVLLYLTKFYKGPSKNLRDIWKAASGFYVDTYSICETMIIQTLQTGAYIGEEAMVLKEYVDGGGRSDLILEYITRFADGYLTRDDLVDGFFFTQMARIYENEGSLPDVCMIAFLKYYAYNVRPKDIPEDIAEHIKRYIHILYTEKGIALSYMQAFADISYESQALSKFTIVQYNGESGSRVVINYMLSGENTENFGYVRDEMQEVYNGLYVKSFLVFFGEMLQYYITEKNERFEELVQSGSLTKNDADASGEADAYGLINDISLSATLKDYDTAFNMLKEYKYKEYAADKLFEPQ